jgi:hypothetical protein
VPSLPSKRFRTEVLPRVRKLKAAIKRRDNAGMDTAYNAFLLITNPFFSNCGGAHVEIAGQCEDVKNACGDLCMKDFERVKRGDVSHVLNLLDRIAAIPPKAKPGPARKYAEAVDLAITMRQENPDLTWKDIWDTVCRDKCPGWTYRKFRDAVKRRLKVLAENLGAN